MIFEGFQKVLRAHVLCTDLQHSPVVQKCLASGACFFFKVADDHMDIVE
jgi:hypothetical protein